MSCLREVEEQGARRNQEADRELGRLEKLPPSQPEHNVIRTWLEYVIELPWNKRAEESLRASEERFTRDEASSTSGVEAARRRREAAEACGRWLQPPV